jgi:hypothetical protein
MKYGNPISSVDFQNYSKFYKINLNFRDAEFLMTDDNMKDGCEKNLTSGILIEQLPNLISVQDFLNTATNDEVINVMYQLYAALYAVRDSFTHYDLHTSNVFIIVLGQPILIEYNENLIEKSPLKQPINIYTRFIPVIIDYGRSFIDCNRFSVSTDLAARNSTGISSLQFTNKACQLTPSCNSRMLPDCDLKKTGMYIFTENNGKNFSNNPSLGYINIRKNNQSSDLRFVQAILQLYSLMVKPIRKSRIPFLETLSGVFNYENNPEWYLPYKGGVLPQEPKKGYIKTITDMYLYCKKAVKEIKEPESVTFKMVIDLSLQYRRLIYVKT